MKNVIVDDIEYKVLKKYPNFWLCENKYGIKTCFDSFDLGFVRKMSMNEAKYITSDESNVIYTPYEENV